MHIQLDDTTKHWLQTKGKPVSVKTVQVNSCCAPTIQDVLTYLGRPKDLHNYTEIKLDTISIFIEKKLSQHTQMTLKLVGIGMFKTVAAKLQ